MRKKTYDTLEVNEIFYSFQGESTYMGRTTLFIRLSECNLRCKTCDTKYAFNTNKKMNTEEIFRIIKQHNSKYVCITGGEPLMQEKALIKLLQQIVKNKNVVSVETNGSKLINKLPLKVKRIIDVKTPSSGHEKSFKTENLKYLNNEDEIKFVISDKKDFIFAETFIRKYKIEKKVKAILMSPNLSKKGFANKLIKWMLISNHNYVFQPQLHKLIKERPIYILK